MSKLNKARFETRAIREAEQRGAFNEHSPALHLTSSYVFSDAENAADIFAERIRTFSYSRFANPTVSMFEEKMALLEGGARATATSTGMGAILTLLMAELSAGDHVVCSRNCFGSTLNMIRRGQHFGGFAES